MINSIENDEIFKQVEFTENDKYNTYISWVQGLYGDFELMHVYKKGDPAGYAEFEKFTEAEYLIKKGKYVYTGNYNEGFAYRVRELYSGAGGSLYTVKRGENQNALDTAFGFSDKGNAAMVIRNGIQKYSTDLPDELSRSMMREKKAIIHNMITYDIREIPVFIKRQHSVSRLKGSTGDIIYMLNGYAEKIHSTTLVKVFSYPDDQAGCRRLVIKRTYIYDEMYDRLWYEDCILHDVINKSDSAEGQLEKLMSGTQVGKEQIFEELYKANAFGTGKRYSDKEDYDENGNIKDSFELKKLIALGKSMGVYK